MKWHFKISAGANSFNLKAEVIYTSHQIEQISINGDGISAVLQNNRPLLEAIELNRPITWKVIEGKISDVSVLEQITKSIENHLKNPAQAPAINIPKECSSVRKSA